MTVAAVDFITRDPAARHTCVQRPLKHAARELRLRCKLHRLGNARCLAAHTVIGPRLGHIQFAVDKHAAAATGIAEEDADLAVLDTACRATVLPLHTGRVLPLLDETGLVHNQHRVTLAQLFNDVLPQHIARAMRIPLRPLEQVLNTIRRCFADPFGELPAVLALDCAQQALQVSERPTSGLRAPEQFSEPQV